MPAGSVLDIPSGGASGAMQAVAAVAASNEVLVAVGDVLQLMCALPFPGKSDEGTCVRVLKA